MEMRRFVDDLWWSTFEDRISLRKNYKWREETKILNWKTYQENEGNKGDKQNKRKKRLSKRFFADLNMYNLCFFSSTKQKSVGLKVELSQVDKISSW